ncbi:MAG: hypothetical protein MK066_14685, partial [Crocinitomicaceae bacterium]|nr:hypothetical protein [Crocinitomicaceae bacterium]
SSEALLQAVGADVLLSDGKILTGASDGEEVRVVSNDSNRNIDNAIRFMAVSPTKFTSLSMQSSLIDGTPESKNYTTQMKSVFVSPWQKSIDQYLNLRGTQNNQANSPQFAEIDFVAKGFQALISNENFLLFTVKKGTILDLTFSIGHSSSMAQEFYRASKGFDKLAKMLPSSVGHNQCR